MRKVSIIALAFLFTLTVSSLPSCSRKVRKIPEGKLSEIYAEMFLADQWISYNDKRRQADTMYVYEPILKKHGYSVEDYYYSVESYMDNPEKFSKILGKSEASLVKLRDQAKAAEREKFIRDSLAEASRSVTPIMPVLDLYEYYDGEYSRSKVDVQIDSSGMITILPVMPDSVFRGPEIIHLAK